MINFKCTNDYYTKFFKITVRVSLFKVKVVAEGLNVRILIGGVVQIIPPNIISLLCVLSNIWHPKIILKVKDGFQIINERI